MLIKFDVAGTPAEFHWNRMNAKAMLNVGDDEIRLQSPWNPTSHVGDLRRSWTRHFDGHVIEVVKVRPLFFAPFRQSDFTVRVDGVVVAEASGK